MSTEKILIIYDDEIVCNFLSDTLKQRGAEVCIAKNGQTAFTLLKGSAFDIVITGMKIPDFTGLAILSKVKELYPHAIVLIITAFGSIENSIEAMRLGAADYLVRPFSPDALLAAIDKAKGLLSLDKEEKPLHQHQSGTMQKVVAESPAMKQILHDIERIAKSNANVFITGETGTGKEVIAQTIHEKSLRFAHPFIKVNCAAIPDTLIESEFFGHEKGAFTGANLKRIGRFELANKGSLLLDEVTEISMTLQAKLLRIIQEKEFERLGGIKTISVDVRLLSTSNRDTKEALTSKILREDLYYRLNVIPIYLPPLRDRPEDIIPLANYFLTKTCLENKERNREFAADAKAKLLDYSWPGNIRELENRVKRVVILHSDPIITSAHLQLENTPPTDYAAEEVKADANNPFLLKGSAIHTFPAGISLQELERRFINETLRTNKNDPIKTAETLGISMRKLKSKLQEYLPQS